MTTGRGPERLLLALLLVVVLTQRLALPLGATQVPLTLVLCLALLAVGAVTGRLVLDRTRTRLYVAAMSTLVLLTVVALLRGLSPSLTSLVLLLLLYAVVAVRPARLDRAAVDRLLDAYTTLMVVVALVCLAQSATQYAGVPYRDWLSVVVPSELLVQGYNTGDPLSYGSDIVRVNGVLFLEPSFVSYFLGLAGVVALHRGRSTVVVALLLLGLVPTLAGNGVVTLVLGVAVLAAGPARRRLLVLVVPVLLAVVVAAVTPVGERFLTRLTEVGNEGSSLSLRLVEPYERLLPSWALDPAAVLLGYGAGAGTDATAAGTAGLLSPALPKLLLEYGGPGTVVFLLFLLWSLVAGGGARPWAPALLVSYLVLNAALLQVTLALTTVLFLHLLRPWDGQGGAEAPEDDASRDQLPVRALP
ncbi:hypothetical protein [Aquipuribacter hungaricus]|uniref:Uncharacterized protein n=1 Tax=Aquipuribacter hungaricus TaxID=545624 RepID=A0ABV7WEC6_9MICO